MKDYFLKTGYQINAINRTSEIMSAEKYWTKGRVRLSSRYQWAVYGRCYEVAAKNRLKSILDVGCGPATKLNQLFAENYEIYGVDQESIVHICREIHGRGIYLAEDFDRPSYELRRYINTVDMIICADVIEHVDDPDKLLEYIRKFSSPQTFVIISTPERNALAGEEAMSPTNPFHIREWAFQELCDYLEHLGFKILEHKTVRPFRFGADFMTAHYCLYRWIRRLPLDYTQYVICKVKS